jgi:predicted nucleic acid-binding protein
VERADSKVRREARSRYVEDVLHRIPVIDFDLSAARRHAALWAKLERAGKMIGPHDLLIAATAIAGKHAVATLNREEFSRVPGLALADLRTYMIDK